MSRLTGRRFFESLLHQWGVRDRLLYWYNRKRPKKGTSPNKSTYPIPNDYLMTLVIGQPNRDVFLESGRAQFHDVLCPMLQKAGHSWSSLNRVLDFGCGCGRLIRHMDARGGQHIWGCDVNSKLVRWCQKNLNGTFIRSNRLPPLPFADSEFDIVLVRSVFTHLREESQRKWLDEFARILKNRGLLWLTLSGEFYIEQMTEGERRSFRAGRLVVRRPWLDGSNDSAVFHPRSFAESLLVQHGFSLKSYQPGGQVSMAHQDCYLSINECMPTSV